MRVLGLRWLATRTAEFDAMVNFAQQHLNLVPERVEAEVATFPLPNGDTFEIYASETAGGGHPADGAIGAFLVDDAQAAHAELAAAGKDVLSLRTENRFQWFYVRAPDGSFYELYSISEQGP
jgi:hypothetical protein